jgi:hypothetical protein
LSRPVSQLSWSAVSKHRKFVPHSQPERFCQDRADMRNPRKRQILASSVSIFPNTVVLPARASRRMHSATPGRAGAPAAEPCDVPGHPARRSQPCLEARRGDAKHAVVPNSTVRTYSSSRRNECVTVWWVRRRQAARFATLCGPSRRRVAVNDGFVPVPERSESHRGGPDGRPRRRSSSGRAATAPRCGASRCRGWRRTGSDRLLLRHEEGPSPGHLRQPPVPQRRAFPTILVPSTIFRGHHRGGHPSRAAVLSPSEVRESGTAAHTSRPCICAATVIARRQARPARQQLLFPSSPNTQPARQPQLVASARR